MKKILKRIFLSLIILIAVAGSYFLLIKKLDRDALEMKGPPLVVYRANMPTLLPSLFIDGERFYIKMPTAAGDTLLALGDSGGGISMLQPLAADKLKLQSNIKSALCKGVMPMKYILFEDVVQPGSTPVPIPSRHLILRHPFSRVTAANLLVPPIDDELRFMIKSMYFDIFLGQNFFMGRAWTFDYIGQEVWVNTPLTQTELDSAGVQQIFFKKNSSGESVYGHPSMQVEIDGEVLDMLFDTGATMVLSEKGKELLHTTEKTIGGSFIARSVFDRWRSNHPDWKYYEHAEHHADIIEVPGIKICGQQTGPVLFAVRPDEAWSAGMIQSMDKVVKGAIGGSALKYFKVVIDYNSELARFSM